MSTGTTTLTDRKAKGLVLAGALQPHGLRRQLGVLAGWR